MKMKFFISTLVLFLTLRTHAQDKYLTKNGTVTFEASVPSFEEVKATNSSVTAIVNTANGEFAALVLVKGFRFKNALMEEHFNENYAESDKFPKATFKGKITNFSIDKLSETSQTFKTTGSLTFHGKTKTLEDVTLNISKSNGNIIISGAFKTSASDFDIDIPKIVKSKIAEDINVSLKFQLKKK